MEAVMDLIRAIRGPSGRDERAPSKKAELRIVTGQPEALPAGPSILSQRLAYAREVASRSPAPADVTWPCQHRHTRCHGLSAPQ